MEDYYINVTKSTAIVFYCSFKEDSDEKAKRILDGIAKLAHKMYGEEDVSVDLYRKVWIEGI